MHIYKLRSIVYFNDRGGLLWDSNEFVTPAGWREDR